MKWMRCPNCGHKLFRYGPEEAVNVKIQIKCSSCKSVFFIPWLDAEEAEVDDNAD